MAKQTFTTGQVLTAAQMTSLQQTAMGGGSATAKTANYVLVAADAGTTVIMNAAGTTTITVNTSLFAAGDSVFIQNIGAGVCTVTAGTATVSTAGSLALAQYEGGLLYFTATGTSIFHDYAQSGGGGGGGKVLQVVSATTTTRVDVSSTTYTDTGVTASITPTLNTSKILILMTHSVYQYGGSIGSPNGNIRIMRDSTAIFNNVTATNSALGVGAITGGELETIATYNYLDSPATTSSTTYKSQMKVGVSGGGATISVNLRTNIASTVTLLEIGA